MQLHYVGQICLVIPHIFLQFDYRPRLTPNYYKLDFPPSSQNAVKKSTELTKFKNRPILYEYGLWGLQRGGPEQAGALGN